MAQCGRSLRCNSCSMCFASVFTRSCARQRLQSSYRLSVTIPIALLLVRPVICLVQNTRVCLSGVHSDFLCRASPYIARSGALRSESFHFIFKGDDQLISLIRRCSTESSATQQARIEPILSRLANFDFFEIGMLRI